MRSGEQIDKFGRAVDETLAGLKQQLPADLIYARTSDQPLQVEESIDLFMKSLYEAIFLVIIVALVGFWELRSALLMALSIPVTLAMTFGMMKVLGIDLQQISIATLIIALGLLVDDPVQQQNYAQIIIQVKDKHDTSHLIDPLQEALSSRIPGARIDVRQLESGAAVGLPVQIRLTGEDMQTLRELAERAKAILDGTGLAERTRDDWGGETFSVKLQTNPDRAVFSGLSNMDVAAASYAATYGSRVTMLREGDEEIPVVARLKMEERAQLGDLQNLYVYSSQGQQKVPLRQVSQTEYGMQPEKVRSRNWFRTITVSTTPAAGYLPSEVMSAARARLKDLEATLPAGYRLEIGGEEEDQIEGFTDLTIVLGISVVLIFLALVFQFKNALKPFIVFAAMPYGMVGALAALRVNFRLSVFTGAWPRSNTRSPRCCSSAGAGRRCTRC